MVAGPSVIVVVADGKNDPEWTAADLLRQSEQVPDIQSILLTDDAAFADAVAAAGEQQIPELSTSDVARTSWDANGAIILVETLKEALPLVDRLAPEHLELAVDDPQSLFEQVRHAGSIFMGRMTPEAVRSEEHTSELPSLMRISYAVFCLTNKITKTPTQIQTYN